MVGLEWKKSVSNLYYYYDYRKAVPLGWHWNHLVEKCAEFAQNDILCRMKGVANCKIIEKKKQWAFGWFNIFAKWFRLHYNLYTLLHLTEMPYNLPLNSISVNSELECTWLKFNSSHCIQYMQYAWIETFCFLFVIQLCMRISSSEIPMSSSARFKQSTTISIFNSNESFIVATPNSVHVSLQPSDYKILNLKY